ncbi:MAG TPA: hypothetical protein VES39_07010, partial [Rhodospirillales bacterium]|nr:hypothetical protein [Rhodospirillales bacterium]
VATLLLAGCQTSSQVGIIGRPATDPGAAIRDAQPYKELGPSKGRSCRYFALAIIPWGDGTVGAALDDALQPHGGDALLNVLVTSSLYTFIPYFNVFSFGCTTLEGVVIAYQTASPVPATPLPATPEPAPLSAPPAAVAPSE